MKKILNILMIAAVALGAVACDNAIDDNLTPEQNGESVSIRVKLPDTRVSLGDYEEGKGYKLSFDEGDELYVASNWSASGGYYFTYTAQEGDEYIFTCTADGVQSIVGTYRYAAYLGGKTQADGAYKFYCDTAAESPKGIVMVVDTHTFGTAPLTFRVAPMLKFNADAPVTIEATKGVFRDGSTKTTYTTKKTGEVYIPLCEVNGETTFTFSINKQVIGKKTLDLAWNGKIYNFGTFETPEPEEEQPVDGDPAGINISITDGVFTDWANITKNVATLPAEATEKTNIKTLKAYADANNIYGYVEFAVVEDNVKFVMGINLDNDAATGSSNWLLTNVEGCELIISSGTFIESGTFALYSAPFAWASYSVGDKTMVTSTGATSIGDGLAAVEFAIAREKLNEYMTSPNIGLGITTYGTGDKKWGTMPYADKTALVIPVHN